MTKTPHPTTWLLLAALIVQAGLWYALRQEKPRWDILPPAPSDLSLSAAAFGDDQFLFRNLALQLQMAGDTGGRVTPLKNYDYAEVRNWLEDLSNLDLRSNWPPKMAAQYFGQSQTPQDHLPYIIAYLRDHVARDPEHKYPWLQAAIYLADVRLQDADLSFDIMRDMAAIQGPEVRPAIVMPYVRRLLERDRVQEALNILVEARNRAVDSQDVNVLQMDLPAIEDLIAASESRIKKRP